MKFSRITKTPEETRHIGELLGGELLAFTGSRKHAFCVALAGDLGAGKTAFTQGFAKGLGIRARVTSPTFVLMKRYPLKRAMFKNVWHIDCYRLEKPSDTTTLGIEELVSDPDNIVIIEWADRIKKYLPKDTLWVFFEHKQELSRSLSFIHAA